MALTLAVAVVVRIGGGAAKAKRSRNECVFGRESVCFGWIGQVIFVWVIGFWVCVLPVAVLPHC